MCDRKFSVKTVAMCAKQMVRAPRIVSLLSHLLADAERSRSPASRLSTKSHSSIEISSPITSSLAPQARTAVLFTYVHYRNLVGILRRSSQSCDAATNTYSPASLTFTYTFRRPPPPSWPPPTLPFVVANEALADDRLWHGEALSRSEDETTYTLPGAQIAQWHRSLHVHKHPSWSRAVQKG